VYFKRWSFFAFENDSEEIQLADLFAILERNNNYFYFVYKPKLNSQSSVINRNGFGATRRVSFHIDPPFTTRHCYPVEINQYTNVHWRPWQYWNMLYPIPKGWQFTRGTNIFSVALDCCSLCLVIPWTTLISRQNFLHQFRLHQNVNDDTIYLIYKLCITYKNKF